MPSNAVEVEGLSKRYLLGENQPGRSLREVIARRLRALGTRGPASRQEIWPLRDVSFTLAEGEALGIVGRNGAGKTTLLKVLAGRLEPDIGTVQLGANVSVGYYAQEHEGIRAGVSLLEHMAEAAPGLPQQLQRRLLGTFGLSGDKVHQDASTLSGGEKTKLALSLLVAGRHNLLLLDEPTNNLDPASREEILSALRTFSGAVVLVSHDEGAVDALSPERIILLPDGVEDLWGQDYADLVALA